MSNQTFHDKIFPAHRCPECGGTAGYSYKMTAKLIQFCHWDGTPKSFAQTGVTEGKVVECENCGSAFRRSTIEKLAGGGQ
jgi:DNA-directed RNA polymerase subunit RPC12/RpoP